MRQMSREATLSRRMSEPQIALTAAAWSVTRRLRIGHCMWHLGGQRRTSGTLTLEATLQFEQCLEYAEAGTAGVGYSFMKFGGQQEKKGSQLEKRPGSSREETRTCSQTVQEEEAWRPLQAEGGNQWRDQTGAGEKRKTAERREEAKQRENSCFEEHFFFLTNPVVS